MSGLISGIKNGWVTFKMYQAATSELSNTSQFLKFTQPQIRSFMHKHGEAYSKLIVFGEAAPIEKMYLTQLGMLEEALVVVGLFGGAENFKRIPVVTKSELAGRFELIEKPMMMPYAVTRVINDASEEQVVVQLGEGSDEVRVALTKDLSDPFYHHWFICEHHLEALGPVLSKRLFLSDEIFQRYSLMIENHFKIEAVAREILVSATNVNCASLALQYAGYPTEAEKNSAQEYNEKRQAESNAKALSLISAAPESRMGCFSRIKKFLAS